MAPTDEKLQVQGPPSFSEELDRYCAEWWEGGTAHRRGRPTDEAKTNLIQLRAPQSFLRTLDRWRAEQEFYISRSEAIRRLTLQAIKAKSK
jgi:hypothetical protein